MIAGTIVLGGNDHGIRPGASMRRGSIVYLQHENAPEVLPTFRGSGRHSADFLGMYVAHLRKAGFPLPDGMASAEFDRFTGDHLELGLGEILIRATA